MRKINNKSMQVISTKQERHTIEQRITGQEMPSVGKENKIIHN